MPVRDPKPEPDNSGPFFIAFLVLMFVLSLALASCYKVEPYPQHYKAIQPAKPVPTDPCDYIRCWDV